MQKLNRYIEPEFLEYSYAYQEGKGIQVAKQNLRYGAVDKVIFLW